MTMTEQMADTLGVDVGGVIIDRVDDALDTSFFGDNFLQTPAVDGAFEALRALSAGPFSGRVFLVSKCGPRVQAKTLAWLGHRGFHDYTGIPEDHVHFCRKREDKEGICRELAITHFVDDRLEVLSYLSGVPALYLFRPDPAEVSRYSRFLPRVRQVMTWQEILRNLLPATARGR
jgi:hypothetical protein